MYNVIARLPGLLEAGNSRNLIVESYGEGLLGIVATYQDMCVRGDDFALQCWNTAAVARPQSSSPYTGEADVVDYRGCRSRLPSVLGHGDLSSRLSISLGIVGVFGSIEFSRMCIYIGPEVHPGDYHQAT
jgi:hypothetical protein